MTLDSNRFRHPFPGLISKLTDGIANSKTVANLRHAVMSRLPFLTLESDVVDVVYVTWLVDVKEAQAFVPPEVRLWQRNGKTPFTALTYKHGNFGPAVLGAMRSFFPSPLQSNWRFYIDNSDLVGEESRAVFFLKNIISSSAYAFVIRIFSDVLQAHLPARFIHKNDGNRYETEIAGGEGSSPSLKCSAQLFGIKCLPDSYSSVFETWESAAEFLAQQDLALAVVERTQDLAISEISLPIELTEVQPLSAADGDVTCSFLEKFSQVGDPFCFLVPKVKFKVLSERRL